MELCSGSGSESEVQWFFLEWTCTALMTSKYCSLLALLAGVVTAQKGGDTGDTDAISHRSALTKYVTDGAVRTLASYTKRHHPTVREHNTVK